MFSKIQTAIWLTAISAFLCSATAARSQSNSLGCNMEQVAGGGQHVLRCQKGVTIIVEETTSYSLLDQDGDQMADGIKLERKGVLIEVVRKLNGSSGFVVVTPQAIAAVRGTKWAVDVQGEKTSVFVVNGIVGVRRPGANERVDLRAGDGVDVDGGQERLVVKQWPAPRVSALLARFGQ